MLEHGFFTQKSLRVKIKQGMIFSLLLFMKFKIEKITEKIYKVSEPYFSGCANIFIFKGTLFNLIVDSGLGMENIKDFLLENNFKKLKLFITHGHFDHCGGVNYFDKEELVIKNKIYQNLKNNSLLGLEYLKTKDFNKKFVKINSFYNNFKIKKLKPFTKNIINNGNFNFKIIATPGHTDDSFVLFDEKTKLLVTGDSLYNGKIYSSMKNSNKKMFIESLNKIKSLNFNLVLPGHGKTLNRKEALNIIDTWLENLAA